MSLLKNRTQLSVIALVIAVGVVVALLPNKGSEKVENKNAVESSSNQEEQTVNQKIETAVEIITSGKGAPMRGIGLLKEVLEEDPNNVQALYYLGVFSIQSGQYDKGVGRFQSILTIEPDNQDARFLLARCLFGNNQADEAKKELNKIMQSDAPKELKDKANELIEEIKKS